MGVMACDRKDCENIMCDRYSHTYGYICDECFDELLSLRQIPEVGRFMKSKKKRWTSNEKELMEKYLYNEFPKGE